MTFLRVVLTLSALLATPVMAADMVPPDPWEVIHIAREFGTAEVTRDAMKDPRIVLMMDGVEHALTFYGCTLGRNCTAILFQARFTAPDWEDDPPPGTVFEAWNASKLFGRAWWIESGAAILGHPVAMAGGLPKETLRATFEAWGRAVDEYREFLDIPDG